LTLNNVETWEDQERVRGQIARMRWLIGLRWAGILGVAFTGTIPQITGYASFFLDMGWLLAPPAIVYNMAFMIWLRQSRKAQWPLSRLERSLRWQAYLVALCDVLTLTTLVYLNGGIENPSIFVPLIAVMVDALILPRAAAFIQANLGAAVLAITAFGSYRGWLPYVAYLNPTYERSLYRDIHAVASTVLLMTILLNLVTYMMSGLAKRLNQADMRDRRLLGRLHWEVREASGRLAESATSLRGGAAEVSQVAGQIATTVHQIAQGADEQATQLERLSRSLEDVASAAHRVAAGALETHQASAQAVATADRGRQAAHEATTRLDEISRVFAQAKGVMAALARHSDEIAGIAAAIDHFAERTDLLALNASVEAARAGEHRQGFAVVAGEVKKLASSSSASAERVAEMVAQVQAEIASIVRSVQAGSVRVEDGQAAIATLREVLDGTAAVIAHTDELAATMESLSLQQRQAHQQIVHAAEEIASAAEETAAGAEETAAAVEQQTTSFSEFSQAAQNLADLAVQLDQAVAELTGETNW
jgi:methyl-accepting chemotaxis protein